MKNYRRLLTIGWLSFLSSVVFAQTFPGDSNQDEIFRKTFDEIKSKYLYQQTLLNRNLTTHPAIGKVSNSKNIEAVDFEEWINIHQSMYGGLSDEHQARDVSPEKFREMLGKFYDPQFRSGKLNEIPLGILHYTVTGIRQEAFDEGRIIFKDDKHFDVGLLAEDFIDYEIFSIVPLSSGFVGNEVTYVLDKSFFFTNREEKIEQINIDFGDGFGVRKMNFGDQIKVSYREGTGEIRVEGKAMFSSELEREFKSDITDDVEKIATSKLLNRSFFDHIDEVSNGAYSLEYGIKLSDCNQGKLKKPIIVAHGFLPAPLTSAMFIYLIGADSDGLLLDILQDVTLYGLYQKYNFSSTLEALRNAGHDIVILRMKNRYASLQNYGELVAKAIKEINAIKNATGSYFETGAIGYSLGGMAIRYALDKMERDLLIGISDEHHHTRIYASYDVGHDGNNLPLGIQSGIGFAVEERSKSGLRLNTMHYLLNTNMAKSAAMSHYTQSLYSQTNEAPHPLRSSFANTLTALSHNKTIVKGYPAFSRNIAISQGSRIAIENNPYDFQDGFTFYNKPGGFFKNGITLYSARQNSNYFKWDPYFAQGWWSTYSGNASEIDNAPGSWDFGLYSTSMEAIANAFANFFDIGADDEVTWYIDSDVDPDCPKKEGGPWCFVPVTSAFDIKRGYLGINQDWNYNLNTGGLMYEYPNSINSAFGYPVVGHPTDHFQRTPFEALCAINENSHHIVGEEPPAPNHECKFEYGNLNLHNSARDFIANEMSPDILKLQNKNIGENTRLDLEYRAEYEAWEEIWFGKEVTWATDFAEYNVYNNGRIDARAGDFIMLEPGFNVDMGGVFCGQIDRPDCHYVKPPSGLVINNEDLSNNINPSFEAMSNMQIESSQKLSIFPNPTDEKINIIAKGGKTYMLSNIQGQKLIEGNIASLFETIDISNLTSGVYFICVQFEDESSEFIKLIKR